LVVAEASVLVHCGRRRAGSLAASYANKHDRRALCLYAPGMEGANMRLILIDGGSGFIFGDTANYRLGRLDEWIENNFDDRGDTERLSLLAARLLDDSIGEHGRDYAFINYDPCDTRAGYLIHCADIDGADIPPIVTDGQNQETIDTVKRDCRFEGFVECRRGCV
jgi:hypothetical protein